MKANGVPSLSASLPERSRLALLETALIASGIPCSKGSDDVVVLTAPAGVYSITASADDSILALSASISLKGYMKGERALQQLLYNVGKATPGIRWLITPANVLLVAERFIQAPPDDDCLWVMGAAILLDQAIVALDNQARLPEHSLWHFANIRSIAT